MNLPAPPLDPALQAEYPFASHYLDLDAGRYHYVDEGSGSPILFVHGNPTWSFAWRNLIKGLRETHRCLAVDHIGCGLSDKPQNYEYRLGHHIDNLGHFIAQQDLQDITLVAHDWGGAIGLGAAVRMPQRFSRLVLMNTAAFRSKAIPWRIAACRIPLFGPLAVRGFNAFSGAATRMAVEKSLSPVVRRGFTYPYDSWKNRIATLRFVEDIPLDEKHPSYATLAELEQRLPSLADKPMLLLWGMRDWCFTPAFLEEFERRFPNAQARRFADAGHYVFEDAPQEILAEITRFTSETTP